jgi:hypothetical protein
MSALDDAVTLLTDDSEGPAIFTFEAYDGSMSAIVRHVPTGKQVYVREFVQ